MTESEKLLERIAGKLLMKIEQRLDSEAALELKDCKTITGALKELKELQRGEEKKDEGLVVRFEGETEECAR